MSPPAGDGTGAAGWPTARRSAWARTARNGSPRLRRPRAARRPARSSASCSSGGAWVLRREAARPCWLLLDRLRAVHREELALDHVPLPVDIGVGHLDPVAGTVDQLRPHGAAVSAGCHGCHRPGCRDVGFVSRRARRKRGARRTSRGTSRPRRRGRVEEEASGYEARLPRTVDTTPDDPGSRRSGTPWGHLARATILGTAEIAVFIGDLGVGRVGLEPTSLLSLRGAVAERQRPLSLGAPLRC
jgi:hypothetical protein